MDAQVSGVAMTIIALLLSVANLLIAYGRSRVKKADVDTQALELTV
jgi:hypothetical protein